MSHYHYLAFDILILRIPLHYFQNMHQLLPIPGFQFLKHLDVTKMIFPVQTIHSLYNNKRNQHITTFEDHHKNKPRNDADKKAHDDSYISNSKCRKPCTIPRRKHMFQSSSQFPYISARELIEVG